MTRADVSVTFADPEAAAAFERYKVTHDIRDLATLPCRYGCKEPRRCRWPHRDCSHCLAMRASGGVTPSVGEVVS